MWTQIILAAPSTVGSKGIVYIFLFLSLCHPAADAWCKPDEKVHVLNSDSREDETEVRESDHEFHCGCSWVESPRVQLKVLSVESMTVSGAAQWWWWCQRWPAQREGSLAADWLWLALCGSAGWFYKFSLNSVIYQSSFQYISAGAIQIQFLFCVTKIRFLL